MAADCTLLVGCIQENAELRQTREEFDYRLREMEEAYEKQSKKVKSKDKKVRTLLNWFLKLGIQSLISVTKVLLFHIY